MNEKIFICKRYICRKNIYIEEIYIQRYIEMQAYSGILINHYGWLVYKTILHIYGAKVIFISLFVFYHYLGINS